MVVSSPRAPAASSTGRSLAPVPTSLTGPGTVRTRAAPGSMAVPRAPGRSPGPASGPVGSQLTPLSHEDLEPGPATFPLGPTPARPPFSLCPG